MSETTKRFTEKHVIITGAGNGIGEGIARRFAAEGARVVVADIDSENGTRVAKDLTETGASAVFCPLDVTDDASISDLITKATKHFGPIHVAVSNAGITEKESSALEVTGEHWDQVYSVNTKGSFMFCRACVNNMMEQETKGSIITFSSLTARSGKNMSGAYASSKAAVIMFTKTLAKAVAPMGIRVNCVSPGVVATRIYSSVESEMMMEEGSFAEWLVEESIKSGQLLIPRAGTPEDIAGAVAFLASDDAAYITAQTLSVDGGMDWCW